ncbi:hypothetical protein KAW48_01830, partial [candidate division WOR-3 bacterium]|nr:hypothetical protein [candidate division WOR-3 bacterium]
LYNEYFGNQDRYRERQHYDPYGGGYWDYKGGGGGRSHGWGRDGGNHWRPRPKPKVTREVNYQPNTPPASYFEGQIWINIGKFFGVTFGYIYSPSQGEFWYVGPTGGVSLWPIGTSVHEGYSDVVEGLNIQLQGGAGLSGQGGWGVFKGRKGFYKESGATYNPNVGLNVVWIWGGY